jgi:hypothetical protein
MEIQSILAAIILILAIVFIARGFLQKAKSFAPKSSCKSDCGCGK